MRVINVADRDWRRCSGTTAPSGEVLSLAAPLGGSVIGASIWQTEPGRIRA